ncbi:hypothetical protein MHU86_4867 [Fragilaria crotonensis]|nr:hypothetical protein MHU86_4867 [Fragilaria crotonensis]
MRGQKVYKRILDSLMSSVHRLGLGEQYDYGRVYTDNEKRQVTPEELMRWLNKRTFGVPDPGPQLAIRPLRTGSNDGNPTKCAEVNDFVKYLRKLEARKQGAESKTRHPMEEREF